METNLRVVVFGVARNVAREIEASVQELNSALSPNFRVSWFVVESDSDDQTVAVLERLKQKDTAFDFETLGNLEAMLPSRIDRIAYSRQRYLDWLSAQGEKTDYVVVADLDGVTKGLSPGSLSREIQQDLNGYCALTANTRGLYYDILALRKLGWVEQDYRKLEREALSRGESIFRAKFFSLVNKQKRLRSNLGILPVESAFGGLAVYRAECILRCSYLAESKNSEECEHVNLSRQLIEKDCKIGLSARLVLRGDPRHTLWSHLALRPFWAMLIRLPKKPADTLARLIGMKAG